MIRIFVTLKPKTKINPKDISITFLINIGPKINTINCLTDVYNIIIIAFSSLFLLLMMEQIYLHFFPLSIQKIFH